MLLAGVTRQAHTPFELAIALGNVAAAKELLSIGGLVEVSEEEPDEEYAGLDVGGKKMDWALEHHGRVAKKKATYVFVDFFTCVTFIDKSRQPNCTARCRSIQSIGECRIPLGKRPLCVGAVSE